MLHRGIRLPSCPRKTSGATPRPSAPSGYTAAPAPSAVSPTSRAPRPAFVTPALTFEAPPAEFNGAAVPHAPLRSSALRLTAEDETAAAAAAMVTTRFIVPHYPTKPGQQLFLSGSTRELGEWDPHAAVPLKWREGHQHTATVRLPASRVVQLKLVLKENDQPVLTEEGDPRDVMLMPVSPSTTDSDSTSAGGPEKQQLAGASAELAAAGTGTAAPEPTAAAGAPSAGRRLDYQVMCHFGSPEATQILRLPVVLPAKDSGDRRALCKFVVMLDGLKLEPRQYPAVLGSAEELGGWKAEGGVKLMRQVGGYWTRRVELPVVDGAIQAKVVICNPDGRPALWEPGTANRVLAVGPGGGAAMHIFVCRWGQSDNTALVSVPVEYERADKEFVKQLDAAQREISIMRRAVTAKSRQCQSLESELAVSRRAERSLREELAGLRSEFGHVFQEVEVAQRGELVARQEVVELREELLVMGESYERQIGFLETKLDQMDAEIRALHEQLGSSNSNGNGKINGIHHQHHDNGSANGQPFSPESSYDSTYDHEVEPRAITRSSWR